MAKDLPLQGGLSMKPANKNIPAIRNSARQKRMIDGLRDARFLGRIDAPAILVAGIAVMALATGGFALARYLENTGYADPEIVRPLPDTRILENIRPSSASYVGATALQNGEGTVLAARANGEVVAVQPQSLLINTETIDLSSGALSGEILEISSGCGWLVPSTDQVDCPMPDSAFALTSNGGVARRTAAGQWESFIADEAWIGLRNIPVSQGDIQTWASSASGSYLALFSPRDGLAIFDQHTGRWHIPADQDLLIAAAKLGAVQIVAQGERFWLGSPAGYGLIDAAANTAPLMWSDPAFNIRDLSRADDGTIWAVSEGPCMEGAETDCLSVQHLTSTTQAEFVMGERSRIADLSMATLAHVAMQGENLVALGSEGIQTYDSDQRSWTNLVGTQVDAYQARNGGALIVASSDNQLFLIENAAIRKQVSTTGGPFKQVEYVSDDLILGLSDGGVVHNLANGAPLSFRDATIAPDTTFTTGASLGTQMLALGP